MGEGLFNYTNLLDEHLLSTDPGICFGCAETAPARSPRETGPAIAGGAHSRHRERRLVMAAVAPGIAVVLLDADAALQRIEAAVQIGTLGQRQAWARGAVARFERGNRAEL